MSRHRLSSLLSISHVGLALLLAALLLATGAGVIRAALLEQARAQAVRAAGEGRQRVEGWRGDLSVVLGLLTERPTLLVHLSQRRLRAAEQFLETYRGTAQLDLVRLERSGQVLVEVGNAPEEVLETGLHFAGDGSAWLAARARLASLDDTEIRVVRRLAEKVLGRDGGSQVLLVPVPPAGGEGDEDLALRLTLRHVSATGHGQTLGPIGESAALRVEPLRSESGEIQALLLAQVPRQQVAAQTLGWLTAFGFGSLAIVVLAAGTAALLARRLARPYSELAHAAERLGVGDLDTPVPAFADGLAEPAALAQSLDRMRRQVLASMQSERTQRQELDAILDGVVDGIVALDAGRCIRYANRQFLELVEAGEDAVLGRFCGDVLNPERRDGVRPCERDCPLLAARSAGLAQAVERCTPGERMRSLVVRSTAPAGGRQVAIVREETPAEAARAMRDAILANLSHEFQTPLAAQVASTELLRDHLCGGQDPVAIRLVEAQFRGTLRLSQLVETLLDSVRIDSGEMRLRREPTDLIAAIEDAVELMRPLTEQRDQRVLALLPRSERVLMGDRQRLSQVVVNLLANANKFAPDHSAIWIDLVWGERYVSLWVEDEGPGLPPLRSPADLFAPFRRAPRDEPSERGTGLGLAIVRAMVERHGGEVVVAEPVHHHGARLGVVLPLEPE